MSTRPTSNFSIRAETLSAVVPALGVVYVEAAVAPTVSGALGLTLDAVTLVATDSVKVQGTLTKTLAAVTLAAPGAVKIQGALTEALAPLAITATVHVFGAVLRATLAKVRLNAVGTARSYSPIVRRQDWPTVLANMVAAAYCEPFAWGTHDCCIWAADVIQAMSENHVDLAASYRGTYSDEAGAAAVISAATGGGDLEDLIESIATANGFLEKRTYEETQQKHSRQQTGQGKRLRVLPKQPYPALAITNHLAKEACQRVTRVIANSNSGREITGHARLF